eukprot:1157722-Pelagomonas_calceolata.AAC.4
MFRQKRAQENKHLSCHGLHACDTEEVGQEPDLQEILSSKSVLRRATTSHAMDCMLVIEEWLGENLSCRRHRQGETC